MPSPQRDLDVEQAVTFWTRLGADPDVARRAAEAGMQPEPVRLETVTGHGPTYVVTRSEIHADGTVRRSTACETRAHRTPAPGPVRQRRARSNLSAGRPRARRRTNSAPAASSGDPDPGEPEPPGDPGRRFHLTVLGKPVPLQRHRTGRGRSYLPARSRAYRELIQAEWLAAGRPTLDELPFALSVRFYGMRANADLDNGLKAVLDALGGLAFTDDRQLVCVAGAHKLPVDEHGPRAEIDLWAAAGSPRAATPTREGSTSHG
jgi:Holliday junction resolvase RusA-like endonuclease